MWPCGSSLSVVRHLDVQHWPAIHPIVPICPTFGPRLTGEPHHGGLSIVYEHEAHSSDSTQSRQSRQSPVSAREPYPNRSHYNYRDQILFRRPNNLYLRRRSRPRMRMGNLATNNASPEFTILQVLISLHLASPISTMPSLPSLPTC